MKTFEGKNVLTRILARLVPPNFAYPDAFCDIIMTEDTLYVAEDLYDGSFIHHFEIPIEKIISISKYRSENPYLDGDDKGYVPGNFVVALLALVGVLYISGSDDERERAKVFLRVDYKNEEDKTDAVFFEDCNNMSGIIRTFKKITRKH